MDFNQPENNPQSAFCNPQSAKQNAPIGIFDSGVGGLTVFRALRRRLPNESLIYLGDTARIPYGTRSRETIERYALEDASFIQSKNVKAIVIACNTASSIAANRLREAFSLPVLGVIRPGSRRAIEQTRNGRIGVIGTEATVASSAYEKAILALRADVEVTSRACPLFVPLAEEGWLEHPVTHQVAAEYLRDFRNSEIDTLVLGCTHYPILRKVIQQVMGDEVTLIDSGEAVADVVAWMLEAEGLRRQSLEPGSEEFFVTDSAQRFRKVAEYFLGRPIESLETIELGQI
jgi:glutamate racemase